ncbi:MAG: PepSY-like domain-containing protein [Tidjanibacter sp.]|nr:PepSY-like domain-containing protein [Tidjanibacter sp.]
MKKIMLLAALVLMASGAATARERMVGFERLPKQAQQLIKTHFAVGDISYITYDNEITDLTYDARFDDGTELEFDRKGELLKAEARRGGSIPTSLLPASITTYLEENHTMSRVVKVERNHRSWEVELSGGTEIVFDQRGRVRWYD